MTTELTTTNDPELAVAVTEAQRQILTQKTPAEAIRHRSGPGGRQLAYVEHRWVNEQLNLAFDWQWSWDIVEWRLIPTEQEPQEAFVLGRLTVHTPRGDLTKTQFGSSDVKRDRKGNVLSIGNDLKAASSDALKKAASLLGLALDLYGSERESKPRRRQPARKPQSGPANGKPKANSNGKPMIKTGRWTGALEALAQQTDYYNEDGKINPYHVLGSLAKAGWSGDITDDNADEALRVLLAYAADEEKLEETSA